MSNKISVDTERLKQNAFELKVCANRLAELRDKMDTAMETLRTEGWQGKGEKAFEAIVEEKLGQMMTMYAELIQTLSDFLNETVVQLYMELYDEAKKLSF